MKKNKFPVWLLVPFLLLILAYISCNLFSLTITDGANKTWATLHATDETLVELGDGSHVVEIDPATALKVGDTDSVFGLSVTVSDAGFVSQAENVLGNWEYWFVEFSVESISGEIQYGIHPVVNTQLQYILNDYYIWNMPEEDQCTPAIEVLAAGLQPNTSFQCRFTYLVPSDDRNLYWVYMRTDNIEDGSYEERYLVYQIR